MPVYDYASGRKHEPIDCEKFEYLDAIKRKMNPRTFKKMIDTVDTALNNLKPSDTSGLVWTKCAALVGYSSQEPTASTNHLWKKAWEHANEDKRTCNMFVGGLIRWRISLRSEHWISFPQITDKIDPHTGKYIKSATYWIKK